MLSGLILKLSEGVLITGQSAFTIFILSGLVLYFCLSHGVRRLGRKQRLFDVFAEHSSLQIQGPGCRVGVKELRTTLRSTKAQAKRKGPLSQCENAFLL